MLNYFGKTLVIILGPTASGKTELAIKIAGWYKTEIISADSRQFYRELTIGTAKPSEEQLAEIRHHFIGHISVSGNYNISKFEHDVLALLEKLFQKHDVVVMCGGSGLYIDAVCNGLDEQPEHDPEIRRKLQEHYKSEGIGYLQQELFRLDPEYYQQVDLANPHRLMRALEVCMISGNTYSSMRKKPKKQRPFNAIKFGIDVSRDELIRRINIRTDEMIANGLVDEARSCLEFRHLNAMNTVGYKEIFDFLDGKCSLDEAVEKIKVNTRRYAKRQMTWFRKDPEIRWVTPDSLSQMIIHQAING